MNYRSRSFCVEQLESRHLLSASPELLVDLNTTQVDDYNGNWPFSFQTFFWKTPDGAVIWGQEASRAGNPYDRAVELYRLDNGVETSNSTPIAVLPGSLLSHEDQGDRLIIDVGSVDDALDTVRRWSTDGTEIGTDRLPNSTCISKHTDVKFHGGGVGGQNELVVTYGVHKLLELTGSEAFVSQQLRGDIFSPSPFTQAQAGNLAYFLLSSEEGIAPSIWSTDGTAAGTKVVAGTAGATRVMSLADKIVFERGDSGDKQLFVMEEGDVKRLERQGGMPLGGDINVIASNESILLGTSLLENGTVALWSIDESFIASEPLAILSQRPFHLQTEGESFLLLAGEQAFYSNGTEEGTFAAQRLPNLDRSVDSAFDELGRRYELAVSGGKGVLAIDGGDQEPEVLASGLAFEMEFVDVEDGFLYFRAGDELWRTDGTVEATTRVMETLPTRDVEQLVVAGQQIVVFDGRDVLSKAIGGDEVSSRIVNRRTDSSTITWRGKFGDDRWLFSTRDPESSTRSLWVTDGSTSGTDKLFTTEPKQCFNASKTLGDWAYFTVRCGNTGNVALMRTRGTADSVETVMPSLPDASWTLTTIAEADGPRLYISSRRVDSHFVIKQTGESFEVTEQPSSLHGTYFSGKWYFNQSGGSLGVTDGTLEGTKSVELPDGVTRIDALKVVGDRLYFTTGPTGERSEDEIFYIDAEHRIRSSDVFIPRAYPSGSSYRLVPSDSHYVLAYQKDGSTFVTVMDSNVTTNISLGELVSHHINHVDGRIFYRVINNGQWEYLSTDGTAMGEEVYFRETRETVILSRTESSVSFIRSGGDTVHDFTIEGNSVFLTTEDGIWRSDGTLANTVRVVQFDTAQASLASPNASANSTENALRFVGSKVLFVADNATYGREMFVADVELKPMLGDSDGDWDVDFQDFLSLSSLFGKKVDEAITQFDFDEDGVIGFGDFLLLAENFGEDLKRPLG